jgi:hypothetical protein
MPLLYLPYNGDGVGLLAGGAGATGDPLAAESTTGKDSYKVKYDVVDLEIGKRLQLSNSVSLRISGGLRYTAIEESSLTALGRALTGTGGIINDNDLGGVGFKAGIAPEWDPINSISEYLAAFQGHI